MQRIAATLGLPIQTVMDHLANGTFPDETTELLHLWATLGAGDRKSVLDMVRSLASRRAPRADA